MSSQYQRGDILLGNETRTRFSITPGVNYIVDLLPEQSSDGDEYGLLELKSQGSPKSPDFPGQWGFMQPQEEVENPANYRKVAHIELGDRKRILVGKKLLEDVPELREFYRNPEDFG
ncbi:MAG: hypothetical protein AABX28_02200 [Nanoarchaeota archaeon]